MVAKTSPVSTTAPEHPALSLSILNQDQINSLAKLQPIYLPNENLELEHPIQKLRNSWKYIYVVNWIYQCRGYVRLQLEYFDVDLFETELLGLVNPPPLDESILFINKLRVGLISVVQGSKCSPNNFEKIFRIWFGSKTPLGGREEEDYDGEEEGDGIKAEIHLEEVYEPMFDNLSLEEKFDVLYIMIEYIVGYANFRTWIDKNGLTPDALRITPIGETITDVKTGTTSSLVLLFDNTRIYKKLIKFPSLTIPKKRKLTPLDPETFYDDSKFDIVNPSTFEMISMGIYQVDKYLTDLRKKIKQKNCPAGLKQLNAAISAAGVIDTLFTAEIKKRKFINNRKKELQLANLLATRKRSSRLEAKEKQKQEDLRLARIQEEEELRIAAEKRLERRRLARNEQQIGEGLTREERLRMRRPEIEEAKVDVEAEGRGEVSEPVEVEGTAEVPENYDIEGPEVELVVSEVVPELVPATVPEVLTSDVVDYLVSTVPSNEPSSELVTSTSVPVHHN